MSRPVPDIEYLYGEVAEIVHLKVKDGKQHEFLKVTVKHVSTGAEAKFLADRDAQTSPEDHSRLGSQMYSRSASDSTPSLSSSSTPNVPARDQVHVCNVKTDLAQFSPYIVLATLSFSPHSFPLVNLTILLKAVHRHAPDYTLKEHQCYWFAHAVFFTAKNLFGGVQTSNEIDSRGKWHRLVIRKEESEEAIKKEYEKAKVAFEETERSKQAGIIVRISNLI